MTFFYPDSYAVPASNPLAWYDANTENAFVLNGSNITTWKNRQNNLFDLTQFNVSVQPALSVDGVNGMKGVSFDATNAVTQSAFPQLQNLTFFVVDKITNDADVKTFATCLNEFWFRCDDNDQVYLYLHNGVGYSHVATTETVAVDVPFLAYCYYDGAVRGVAINDTAPVESAYTATLNTASAQLVVGNSGGNTSTHIMSELILYDRKLSPAEIDQTKRYLQTKYKLLK